MCHTVTPLPNNVSLKYTFHEKKEPTPPTLLLLLVPKQRRACWSFLHFLISPFPLPRIAQSKVFNERYCRETWPLPIPTAWPETALESVPELFGAFSVPVSQFPPAAAPLLTSEGELVARSYAKRRIWADFALFASQLLLFFQLTTDGEVLDTEFYFHSEFDWFRWIQWLGCDF